MPTREGWKHLASSIVVGLLFIGHFSSAQEIPTLPCSAPPTEPGIPAVPMQPQPPLPPRVVLNEVLPDPSGTDDTEFIEVTNLGSDDVDLAGWSLADESEKTFTMRGAHVPANGPLMFMRAESKIILNNDHERVRLIDPAGVTVSEIAFDAAGHSGESYARSADGMWTWTARPTPGEKNVIEPVEDATPSDTAPVTTEPDAPIPTEPILPSVETIIEESGPGQESPAPIPPTTAETAVTVPDGSRQSGEFDDGATAFSGIVTVPPGRISKATFLFLEDGGRGFVVRLYGNDGPSLGAGDRVTLRGRLHDDERPWISAKKKDISSEGPGEALRYGKKDVAALSAEDLGLPVEVRGSVIAWGEHWVRIADAEGQGEIKATLPDAVSAGVIEDMATATLRGIVRPTAQGLELVMLAKKDMMIEKVEGQTHDASEEAVHETESPMPADPEREPLVLGSIEKRDERPIYGIIASLTVASAIAALWWKRRRTACE